MRSLNYPITAAKMLYDYVREELRAYLDNHISQGGEVQGDEFERILRDVFELLFSYRAEQMPHGDEDIQLRAYFEDVIVSRHDMTALAKLQE